MNDLLPAHRISELCFGDGSGLNTKAALANTRKWLKWQVLNSQFPRLRWWADRAIVLKDAREVIGQIALVPMPGPFERLLATGDSAGQGNVYGTVELSMLWAVLPEYRRRGYATEAARAVIDFAFRQFGLRRIVADTGRKNIASQGVMRKVGMRLVWNTTGEPDWLEVVGVIENPRPPQPAV